MKKILLVAVIAGMGMVACKKDRVCSCKVVEETNPVTPPQPATVVTDYKYTMVKTGLKTAYNACTHTKTSETTGSVTVTTDTNCSLE